MAKKYIKCPRCELNYILEDEDYCSVCKNEMKHHSETDEDEDLLDFDDMELCHVCGQNYVKEDQTICDECRKKKNEENGDFSDDSSAPISDIDSDDDDDDDYASAGFSEIDENGEEIDPFKETSLLDDDDDSPIDFAMEDDGEIEDEVVEEMKDDFEVVDVSDDDDEEEEEEDDYDFDEDDMLGKKK